MYWYNDTGKDVFKEDYIDDQTFVHRFKKAAAVYISLAVIGITSFLILAEINYIDIPNACYMSIKHNVVSGDSKSIREALKLLRSENYFEYKNVCRYARTIYERDCILADDKTPKTYKAPTDGCFIEGTKSIMIKGESVYSPELVQKRKQQIQKYGDLATKYWLMSVI